MIFNKYKNAVFALCAATICIGRSAPAGAEEGAPKAGGAPVIEHHPIAKLTGSADVLIDARIQADWKLEEAWVAVRPLDSHADYRKLPLERTGDEEFAALVPSELVEPPGIEYYIASRDKTGRTRHHFTSPAKPHKLLVTPTRVEREQQRRLSRYDGDRSRFEVRGEYTAYGRRNVRPDELGADEYSEGLTTDAGTDSYWVTELEYTYRLLTWLHDIRFGVGRLRGEQPTITVDDTQRPVGVGSGAAQPGYDYGFGKANLALHENFSLGFELILGASDEGFAAGGGAVIRVGRIDATYFELGGQLQAAIGSRGWMSFAWDTVPAVPMALTIELSERPDEAAPAGTRLLYDLGYEASDAVTLEARVGYASRSGGLEGGFVAGMSAAYEF